MKNENSNCCDTDNSGCNTQETNCCSTEKKTVNTATKKKVGLGILLVAITFAVAFNTVSASEGPSCNSGQEECTTSCQTGSKVISCCLKK